MIKVAVVILNWNGRKILEQFLPSVIKYSSLPSVSIIVADNGSTDDSIKYLNQEFPSVDIVQLDKNYGFAGGYNKALQQIEATYYVLLNSDIEVTESWIEPVIDFMDKCNDVAACMPKIKSYSNKDFFEHAGAAGGFIDKYGYPFCRGRILYDLEKDTGQYNQPVDIFWASGACMFVRASVYKENHGFDEFFFAHMEEIDLCWRIKNKGYRIVCIPQSEVYHLGGGTLDYSNPRKLYLNFRNSLIAFYKNTPSTLYHRFIYKRTILDIMAFSRFILTLKIKPAFAILRAYRDFLRVIGKYKKIKKSNLQSTTISHSEMLKNSIVMQYWFYNKRSFNKLDL